MTIEERMVRLENKVRRDEDEKARREKEARIEQILLKEQIGLLEGRIKEILALANKCIELGIEIPESEPFSHKRYAGKAYGYDADFVADGIWHHVGFYRTWGCSYKRPYAYLAILNGGACGPWDFVTDGMQILAVSNRDYYDDDDHETGQPRTEDMKKFLREFPVFESAFLKWIDSL